MPLSKERMREYQENRRKKLKESSPLPVVDLGVEGQMKGLQTRVEALEFQVKALQTVTDALQHASKVADKVAAKGVGKPAVNAADLFARVVAEKEARLR